MPSGSSTFDSLLSTLSLRGRLGLRGRIVILGGIIMIPMILLAVLNARHSADTALEEARQRAQLLVAEENLNYDDLIQQSKVILDLVAHSPEIRNPDTCTPYLAGIKSRYPWLNGLFVTEASGDRVCTATPTAATINPSDRAYFKQAIATRQLAISNFLISRVNQKPVITAALPVLNATGDIELIVGAAISLESLNELIAADNQRRGIDGRTVSTTIVDGEGTIVARYPALENCIGEKAASLRFVQEILQRKEGGADMPGLAGDERIFAFQPFAGTPSFIAIGIAKAPILAAIDDRLHRTLGIILAVMLGSIGLGLLGSEVLILRPQRQLANLAQRIGAGDYAVEAVRARMPEVRELQASFISMAGQLQEREAALNASREEIHQINHNLLLAEQVAHVGHWRLDLGAGQLVWSEELYCIHGVDSATFTPSLENSLAAYHPDDRPAVQRLVDWAIGFTRDFEFALRIVRPGGEVRHVLSRGFCEMNEAGEVVSIFGVLADITMLKEAEFRLKAAQLAAEAANDAKSEFLSTISHELRQPLTSIIGFADLLLERSGNDKETTRYLDLQRSSGEHLLMLINDLLDHSKLEAGMVDIEQAPFSVDELLETSAALLAETARRKQVRLLVDVARDLPPLLGDSARLKQILLNLGGNALKFTPAGVINLRCRLLAADQAFHRLRFEVEDSGIGIPADKLPHLFQRFRQADSSISWRFGGTGLGLTISKELVAAMHGEMGVTSVEGQGSTFWFEIPFRAVSAGAADESTALEKALQRVSRTPAHILLAEDSPINQALFSEILHDMGHSVTLVTNGLQALHLLERAPPADGGYDLVLMDVEMPELDGLNATRLLRERGITLPIVGLTGHATPADAARCTEAGMNDYLVKPVDFEELFAMVERYRPEVSGQMSEVRGETVGG
jgi:signal transduction histidine kinase/CheY-like chemotaxis protein/HAMP domain-containing protein